jgi:quinol monooxygenase YgiN
MLTFTATLTVKAGHEQEFERIMSIAVPKVREEPGNRAIFFTVLRKTRVSLCSTKSMMIRRPWRRIARTCA